MSSFSNNSSNQLEKILLAVLSENQRESFLHYTKILKNWELIIGKPLAAKTFPQKIEKKILHVLVCDASYSHHLKYFEDSILELIGSPEICGEGAVKKIQYHVGDTAKLINDAKKEDKPRRPPKTLDPKSEEKAELVSNIIRDPKLRKSFSSFMKKSLSSFKEKDEENNQD
ncbi:MAG: DUF721 domain-containing protein [Deltaproteobacteria bacterium]|nr:DUF721 domain-containing protein [Deltaproteobacteria bacterium]